METPDTIRSVLSQAYGTSQYWKVFPDLLITDGVKFMAEMCEAYWLLNEIFFMLHDEKLKGEEFIVFQLTLKGRSATLKADDGNKHLLASLEIPFTDFPLQDGITIYWCDNVLLLPTEY